jgi:L-alanine-DL-glutamate epimerase-like enolase superfamily enzyme
MKVAIQKKYILLHTPFVYYLDTLESLPYAEVTITSDEGIVGKGEIPCALDINGETAEGSIALAQYLEHWLSTFSIHSEQDIVNAMEMLSMRLAFNEATRFGIEQALYDILAQRKKTTISKIFGADAKKIKMQVTIPYLGSEDAYATRIQEVLKKKPTHLKIKVGAHKKREQFAIQYARSLDSQVSISADANQAFSSVNDAVLFLEGVPQGALSWIEQPLTRYAPIQDWIELKKRVDTKIMADESIHTQKDAEFFMQNSAIDYINLKLAKCGGVTEARKIIETAKQYNVPVMLGSMLEGELALKYNLAFGLSVQFIAYDFSRNYAIENARLPLYIDEETLYPTQHVLG